MGHLAILSVGSGDTKLTCDPNDKAGMKEFARIVKDMLRRGYSLLIDTGILDDKGRPLFRRAKGYDAETHEYIIAGIDPEAAKEVTKKETASVNQPSTETRKKGRPAEGDKVAKGGYRVPASQCNGVAVAHTAGG